ncbi:MAG: hypothetical protein U0R50_08625 [Gaiellales bacterium]
MPAARLRGAVTVALVVTVGVCAGARCVSLAQARSEATPSPPRTFRSADGAVTVSVPRGALRAPASIRIRLLAPASYPPELRGAKFGSGAKLYSLEPAGLRLLKPVTITRRFDATKLGFDLAKAVPGIVLTLRSRDGKWEVLRDQLVRTDGRQTLIVSGTARHFSTLVAFDGAARLTLTPESASAQVGGTFEAAVVAQIDNARRADPINVSSIEWIALDVVGIQANRGSTATFVCQREGKDRFGATVRLAEDNLAVSVASLFSADYEETFRLRAPVECTKAPPTDAELVAACVLVSHSPFGSDPSFLRWLLAFAPRTVSGGGQAQLTVAGMNGGQPVSGTIDANGKVELKGGIRSYGDKQIQRLAVAGRDVTSQLVAKVGSAAPVGSSQGVVAGTCP